MKVTLPHSVWGALRLHLACIHRMGLRALSGDIESTDYCSWYVCYECSTLKLRQRVITTATPVIWNRSGKTVFGVGTFTRLATVALSMGCIWVLLLLWIWVCPSIGIRLLAEGFKSSSAQWRDYPKELLVTAINSISNVDLLSLRNATPYPDANDTGVTIQGLHPKDESQSWCVRLHWCAHTSTPHITRAENLFKIFLHLSISSPECKLTVITKYGKVNIKCVC